MLRECGSWGKEWYPVHRGRDGGDLGAVYTEDGVLGHLGATEHRGQVVLGTPRMSTGFQEGRGIGRCGQEKPLHAGVTRDLQPIKRHSPELGQGLASASGSRSSRSGL
jgi:hypothetical protein